MAVPVDTGRQIWHFEPTSTALVLGSTQDLAAAAPARDRGIEVVRRRSGGGAVLVEPNAMVWVDVIVPAADPLFDPDVGRAFMWLGEAWKRALGRVGIRADVHDGPLEAGPWGKLVCFAGLGPGELTVDGRKVVGMSQRRSRAGARFQCTALLRFDPARTAAALDVPEARRGDLVQALTDSVGDLSVSEKDLRQALESELPGQGVT